MGPRSENRVSDVVFVNCTNLRVIVENPILDIFHDQHVLHNIELDRLSTLIWSFLGNRYIFHEES